MNTKPKFHLSSKLVSNVIYNYIGFFFVSISGFLLFPFTLHIIGDKTNGVLLLINTIINYFGLLDLGVATTVMKMVAEHSHDEDKNYVRKIVVNGLVVFTAIGILMILIGLSITPFLGIIFRIPSHLLPTAQISYAIFVIAVGLVFPTAIFQAVFSGYQNYKLNNIIGIIQVAVAVVGTIIALELGYGLIGLAVVTLVSNVVVMILRIYFTIFKYDINIFDVKSIDFQVIRSIFLFSRWILLITIASRLIFQSDTIVIGMFATTAAITAYQIALSPNIFLRKIGDQFNGVTFPASASLNARNDVQKLQRLLKESTRVTTITMIPFLIVFLVWGRDYITLWVGKQYVFSYPTLVVLTIGIFAATIQGTANQIIIALNKHKVFTIVTIGEAIINVILSIFLLHKMGIIGVALGTTLPTLITSFGFSVLYSSFLVTINPWKIYLKILGPLFIAIPFGFLAFLFNQVVHIHNFLELFMYAGVLYGSFFIIALLFEASERQTYITIIKNFGNTIIRLAYARKQ
ncbi:MAG TPA: oligosaccharide flippase family protein [Candidatus Saccharimonadales bacterium]|nr:oligosaccharide flippase family protein [Candidatus Saccharimonadales bacterium]